MGTNNRNMKKIRIKGYCLRTWSADFKQLALVPCLYYTHNPVGNFIETGVSTNLWVISINFLAWDFGFKIYEDLKY